MRRRLTPFFVFIAGLPAVLLLSTYLFASVKPGNLDDAFILLVYVRHLATHGSIYWNVEEGHVDGCTSILDTVVKAGVWKAFGGELLFVNWWTSFVLYLAIGVVGLAGFLAMARRAGRAGWAVALVGALAIAGNRAVADGASYLLETQLFIVVVLVAVLTMLLVQRWTRARLVLVSVQWILVALARPEGLALVVLFYAWFLYEGWYRAEVAPLTRRELALPAVVTGVTLGLYFAWHTAYFGHWAPNTYYAKKSDNRWLEVVDGVNYVRAYLPSRWAKVAVYAIPASLLLALVPRWKTRRARVRFTAVSAIACINLATIIFAGGDCYWGSGRFLACATTLTMVALVVAGLGMRGPARWVAPAVLLVLAGGSARAAGRRYWEKRELMRERWPLRMTLPDMSCEAETGEILTRLGVHAFAQTDFQRLKFFRDEIRVVDASGLNDRAAAHGPAPHQVIFGKGGVAFAAKSPARALSYGYAPPIHYLPMASFSSRELVYDYDTSRKLMGSPVDMPFTPPSDAPILYEGYRPVSTRACGSFWFNFWAKDDLADALSTRSDVRVGRRDPELLIPLEGTEKMRLYGFWPTEEAWLGQPARWTGPRARVELDALPPFETEYDACTLGFVALPGSRVFELYWDDIPLARFDQTSRYVIHLPLLDPKRPHMLRVEAEASRPVDVDPTSHDERPVGALVAGMFIDCGPPPWVR